MGTALKTLAPPALEEISIRQGDLDLRLVLNRVHRHLRVMDFRVGSYHEKRDMLDALAARENLRKVFTIVEKSDGQSWRAVGFSREGVVPGFFRTADGYVLSRMYDAGGPIAGGTLKAPAGDKIGMPRRKARKPDGATLEVIVQPTRLAQIGATSTTDLRLLPLVKALPAPDMAVRVRHRRDEHCVTVELDDSFGHGRLDFMSPRRGAAELLVAAYAGQTLLTELARRGATVTAFGVSAHDDAWSTDLLASLGFKVTARLADHIGNERGFAHACIWHRKVTE